MNGSIDSRKGDLLAMSSPTATKRKGFMGSSMGNSKDFKGGLEFERTRTFTRRTTISGANAAKIVSEFDSSNMGTRHKYISETGKYIYHIAIIDYLQDYNLEKKAENWIKVWVYQRKEELMSAVNSELYMKRFYKFMKENVIIN